MAVGQGRPDSQEDDAGRLAQLLVWASEMARADLTRVIAEYDLPLPLARAVLQLDEPAPMRDLALALSCDRSHVTGMADGLEERGLVQRVPGVDRRVKLLALTERGRTLRSDLNRAVAAQSRILAALSREEQRTLEGLLVTMVAANTPASCIASVDTPDCSDGV